MFLNLFHITSPVETVIQRVHQEPATGWYQNGSFHDENFMGKKTFSLIAGGTNKVTLHANQMQWLAERNHLENVYILISIL